jgi:hypothetical protein
MVEIWFNDMIACVVCRNEAKESWKFKILTKYNFDFDFLVLHDHNSGTTQISNIGINGTLSYF